MTSIKSHGKSPVQVLLAAALLAASAGDAFARAMFEPPEPERAGLLTGVSADLMLSTAGIRNFPGSSRNPYDSAASGELPCDIPVLYNGAIEDFIRYFRNEGRKGFEKWLSRSTRFIPEIRRVLKAYKLPEDTVYLAMIESGFSPFALSKSAAAGIWQFIPATGMRYGLKIDYWRDERRDPVKSTHAAAMYLRDLYRYFGSWWLAWAGYNSGEMKIFRALERFDTDDFWELSEKRFLRRETRQYVPKLIAAALISKNPGLFGFDRLEFLSPMEYEEVEIPSPADLRVVARSALADLETIESLNPELRRGCTPPGQATYVVRIPKGSKERFREVFQLVPAEDRMPEKVKVAGRKDTISKIAKAAGVSPRLVAEYNGYDPTEAGKALGAGTEIRIPMLRASDRETEERWDKKLDRAFKKMKGKKPKAKYGMVGTGTRGPL